MLLRVLLLVEQSLELFFIGMFLPVVFELHLAELAGVQFFHLITLLNVIAQHFILSTLFLLELTIEFFLFIFKLASQAIDLSIFLTA